MNDEHGVGPDTDALAVPAEGIARRRIHVGLGGKLVVPREDLGMDGSSDLDFSGFQLATIRKPGRHEWFALNPEQCLETRLLPLPSGPGGMDKQWFYVHTPLREPVQEDIRDCIVYPYLSLANPGIYLWIVVVNEGNGWFESLRPVFEQPASFYQGHVIRVVAHRLIGRYKAKQKAANLDMFKWPDRPTQELLGEALTADNFINDAGHPVYRSLIEGDALD